MITALAMAGCGAVFLVTASTAGASVSVVAPGSASVGHGAALPAHTWGRSADGRLPASRPSAMRAKNTFTVGGGPLDLASDSRTKTLYVVTVGKTIALVSTARCNRLVRSGCKVVASVPGQAGFAWVVVDASTHTLYALFGGTTGKGHTVQVLNGARCNAAVASGCRPVATVQVGRFPIGASLDAVTHTLYVSNNYSNTVSMINTAACNATRTAGCAQRPRTVRAGAGPNLSAVDPATRTLYVPNDGPGGSDGNTGNNGTTVSLINTATCNATRHISCHQVKPTATVGAGPGPGASNPRTHSVYVVNINDDTVSVLDSATCNARHPAGCPPAAATLATGALPEFVLPDPATDTLYVTNLIDNTVSVLSGAACNATRHSGCRRLPPAIPLGGAPGMASVNAATHTVYVANQLTGKVQVINGVTCNARHPGGCGHIAASVKVGKAGMFGSDAIGVAVNQATNTIYVVNAGEGGNSVVRVISGAACNATHTAGCRRTPATIHVGKIPIGIAVDQVTDTVYVANAGSNTISVINGATCNGTDHSGCGQVPATLAAPGVAFGLAVNQATDSLYATQTGTGTLAVFNAATCNATDTSGCGQTPATVTVGSFPEGVAVDQATDTVYVANNVDGGDAPASVSVINGATCNGTDHTGCGQVLATAPVGRGAFGVAVDQTANEIVVATFNEASVRLINGDTCNATDTTGCSRMPVRKPAGSGSLWVAAGGPAGTAYVSAVNDNELAVISTGR